jgi:hypothetical protein
MVRAIIDLLCGVVVRVPGYREVRVRFPALSDFLSIVHRADNLTTICEPIVWTM